MVEVWEDVKGYEGLYRVSNTGKVFSLRSNREMRSNAQGYLVVGLCKNRKQKCHYIHRLVAEAFIPNPLGLPEVNHKDCDKTNNRVENLEWVTHTENVLHCIKMGQFSKMKYRKTERQIK